MDEITLKVDEKSENKRLDIYIRDNYNDLSRNQIQKLIESENILVNRINEPSRYKVKVNDEIKIFIKEKEELELIPEDLNLDIIYEDKYLAIINKPIDMVVHPSHGHKDNTLVNGILYEFENLSDINGEFRPGIVHRLDKDTSGLIIIAKDNKSHKLLADKFKNRDIIRSYKALVFGNINEDNFIIDKPIARDPNNRQRMAIVNDGRESRTIVKVIERFGNYTFLDVELITGRTHQIRVHLSSINHPIVGDQVYSRGKNEFNLDNQFLYSDYLEFEHPRSKDLLKIQLEDIDDKFKNILKALKNRKA